MDGSIHERINAKGKKVYDVFYRVLNLKTGKKLQKLKRGFTKKSLAQDFLTETANQIKNNAYVDSKKVTTKGLMNEWYKKYVEGKLAPNTVRGYSVNIYKHIIPGIGFIPLQQLTTKDIQNFYDEKLKYYDEDESSDDDKNNLSAKSIIYIHRNLSKALDYAVKEKLILTNPAKDVELPSPEKFHGWVYDQKAIIELLRIVKDTEMELPIALAGLSGLRRGEVAGMVWDDIDLEKRILTVRKQRTTGNKASKRSKVKTAESYRCIRFSNALLEILERHNERQKTNKRLMGEDYKDLGFVCCEADGNIINPSNFSKRFSKILEINQLAPIRFHDLRHSFATNMIRLGIPVNTVSKMLGHSSPVVTLTVYAHVLNEMQDEAVSKLDADIEKYINKIDKDMNDSLVKEEIEEYLAS